MDKNYLEGELKIVTEQLEIAYEQLRIEEHSKDYRVFLAERAGYWRGRQALIESLLAETKW